MPTADMEIQKVGHCAEPDTIGDVTMPWSVLPGMATKPHYCGAPGHQGSALGIAFCGVAGPTDTTAPRDGPPRGGGV